MSPLGRGWPARLLALLSGLALVLVAPALEHAPDPGLVQAYLGLVGVFIAGDTWRATGTPSAPTRGQLQDLVGGLPGQVVELLQRARGAAPAAAPVAPAAPRPVARPAAPPPVGDTP